MFFEAEIPFKKIFSYQLWHLLVLIQFLWVAELLLNQHFELVRGSLWDIPTRTWVKWGMTIPIIHQFYVLLCWRFQLYYQSITKTFGPTGFTYYKIGFAILILLRPLTVTLIAMSNPNTLAIPEFTQYGLILVCLLPAVYLFYSVKKYFGIDRAFGRDHFYPEEYRHIDLVKKGIFKYTDNGMYLYGFLILYIPGILYQSEAALLVAVFNHLYIWVHYYFTELPDMKYIYGERDGDEWK